MKTKLRLVCVLLATVFAFCPAVAHAQLTKELAKQAGKAVVRESVEAGAKTAVKQAIKAMGVEAAETAAKRSASAFAKGGMIDEVAGALSRNGGTIIGGATLATAVVHADQVIAAGSDVVKTGITTTATNVAQPIAKKAAEGINLVFWIIGLGCLGGLAYVASTRWYANAWTVRNKVTKAK